MHVSLSCGALLLLCGLLCPVEATNAKNDTRWKLKKFRAAFNYAETVNPDEYLERYAYLDGKKPHSPTEMKQAIMTFQGYAGIHMTGELNEETVQKMKIPRCGCRDITPVQNSSGPQFHSASGHEWPKNDLTFKFLNYHPDLDGGSQRRAINNALQYWSDVTPLTFKEIVNGKADLTFEHTGDIDDGRGHVLAMATLPTSGVVQFDSAEPWSVDSYQGVNLEIVAAHEIGHALGLDHSNVWGALMYPTYRGYDPNFKLHSDDISGIQKIYGPPLSPTAAAEPASPQTSRACVPTTTPRSTEEPDSCTTSFDAVHLGQDHKIYAYKDQWIWQLNDWASEPGYPRLITDVYDSRAPSQPGSAVYSPTTKFTYFFGNRRVWKYQGFERVGHRHTAFDFPDVQAALWSAYDKIYLFQGSDCWEFDETTMDLKSNQPQRIADVFPGVPSDLDAAVRLRTGFMYFFKGDKYWQYSEVSREVKAGYPKPKAGAWMGPMCGGKFVPK